MAWSTLASNQFITFQDAIDSPFTKLQTIPTNNLFKFMTKVEVIQYLNIQTANLNGLTLNQWVRKELLASGRIKAWRGIYPYCIQQGNRPLNLLQRAFYASIYRNGWYQPFSDTLSQATTALNEHIQLGYTLYTNGCESIDFEVGSYIYNGWQPTYKSLNYVPDGYYIFDNVAYGYDGIFHIVDGILVEKIPYLIP